MHNSHEAILTIGCLLIIGLLASTIAKRTYLPRVTILICFGATIGSQGLDLIPSSFIDQFDLIADMTLLMIGFLLGGKIHKESFRSGMREVLSLSLCSAIGTSLVVFIGLTAFGVDPVVSLILACIASATDPVTIFDVSKELNSKTKTSEQLLNIVALDDIWALILFAIGIAILHSANGNGHSEVLILNALFEIGGSVLLGILIGYPASLLTGRFKEGQPVVTEALGIVFLCGGLSMLFDLSHLIAAMVMGAVISNYAKHHEYPFHAIEDIEAPFMVLFFILAGASLQWESLQSIGYIGLLMVMFRTIGKIYGTYLGGAPHSTPKRQRLWMGTALLPQAGIAIGMALVASSTFPEYRNQILSIAISTTVFFELIGPIFTRLAIRKMDTLSDSKLAETKR